MKVDLRETGSIRVKADQAEVLDVLRRIVRNGAFVAPGRLEGDGSTYVVRPEGTGTKVIHMRSERAPVATASREREELRRAVQADLFQLQRVLDVEPRA